ncbi:hypothetical protein V3C99_018899 [Haemonchus contortus]
MATSRIPSSYILRRLFVFYCLMTSQLVICLSYEMACEKIGEPVKSVVAEPNDYHQALLTGDRVWMFGRAFVNQPSHNWGHRIVSAGTYGVAFNLGNNKWEEPHKFPALSNEENISEILFVLNKSIYLLLFTAFGELSMKSVHKWTGSGWESLKLESFQAMPASDPSERVTMVVAEGPHEGSTYLVSNVGHKIRVAHLKVSDGSVSVTHVVDVPEGSGQMGAQAVSAVEAGDRLLIGYGVHGCGFRWDNSHVIVCDLNKKTCEGVQIPSEPAPRWGFDGARAHYLSPSGVWIHAAGTVPQGMHGGSFEGSIWALTNLSSTPAWRQLEGSIPTDGDVVIGNGRVINIDKDGVHSQPLKEN